MSFFIISTVNAKLTLNIEKENYKLDETVKVFADITNEGVSAVKWRFQGSLYSDNPSIPIPRAPTYIVELLPGQTKTINFSFPTNNIQLEGKYEARGKLFDENYKMVDQASKSFNLVDTIKLMTVDAFACKDSGCTKKEKVFLKGELIYLNYRSSINSNIDAILTYPNNVDEKIQLPYTLKADQIGSYSVSLSSTKASYKTVYAKYEFAVIKSPAIVETVFLCNGNKICEPPEDSKNCLVDCPIIKAAVNLCKEDNFCDKNCIGDDLDCRIEQKKPSYKLFFVISIIIIIVIIILAWLYETRFKYRQL